MSKKKTILLLGLLLLAVSLIYARHFHNEFHFDDFHTAVQNPYIRDLHNIPRFFTDARTFSVRPLNRMYRPLVSTSLALDYWLGGGLDTFYFQLSTFCWFLLQLVLMYLLFRRIYNFARPDPRNGIVALVAAAWYGVHPAMAETVNYIIQRGDVYSTLGPTAGILIYAAAPKLRKFGLYLLPVAAALLSKPPAMVFPALLFVYVWLFESDDAPGRLRRALLHCTPALLMTAALGYLNVAMTPREFHGGAPSAYAYRITQPLVALRYFRTFFLPGALTADTDHAPIASIWNDWAWAGFLFVIAVVVTAAICSRKREWRPVAFGLWWFLLALVPTSIYPLAEVENDHRMFFPFVGLVLSATWPVALWIYRQQNPRKFFVRGIAAVCCFEFAVLALGTMQRNIAWRTEESLWRDVSIKSPHNPRGLMNYAVALIRKGEPAKALELLEEARTLSPKYGLLEANLGAAQGALKDATAEEHFLRGLQFDPGSPACRHIYAKWLNDNGREAEAIEQLRIAVKANPDYLDSVYFLIQIYAQRASWQTVDNLADYVLRRFPSENSAKAYRLMAATADEHTLKSCKTAATLLSLSALYYKAGKFESSLGASKDALTLRANFPEAYNNLSAAHRGLGQWDEAVGAAQQALLLRPDYRSAQQNLANALEGKRKLLLPAVREPAAHRQNAPAGDVNSPSANK
jgi:tetratricopeptide (TPR) repeat protein